MKNILTTIILTLIGMNSFAASVGVQEFEFLANIDNSFWIAEDIGGEYRVSKLHRIELTDENIKISTTTLPEYKKWQPILERLENIPKLPAFISEPSESALLFEDFAITPPESDPQMAEKFNQHIHDGGSNGQTWNEKMGEKGIHKPRFDKGEYELLHHYRTGMYINYQLARAYLSEDYLLIFTIQPIRAVGLDTMHGFMIFRIQPDPED